MNNAEQLITPDSNPAPTEGAAQVMMRFQDVMSRFLDTQKSVMLNFLGSQPATPAPSRNAHAHSNGNGHANGHAPLPALPKTPSPLPVNRLPASEPLAKPVATPASTKPAGNGQAIVKSSPTPSENGKAHSSEVAITTASKPAADMSRDGLLAQLIDLVSDRTGYPKEAISIDLDLEADLGIDSIKRVEILGTLAETLETAGDGKQPNLEMEKLSVIKTLRGIADYVSSAFTAPAQSVAKVEVAKSLPPASHPGARQGDIQRLVVRLIDAPLPIRQNFTPPNGTVLITDDGQGYARELADRLGERDVNAVLVQHKPGELGSEASFAGDLSDPAQVETLLDRLRTGCGPIAGLIHLLPLAEDKDGIPPLQRTTRNLKSLYLLARGLEADLRQAGENGGAVFLAVTTLGGTMGYGDHLPERSFAGDGGIAGFVKCVGYEWPEVTVRVVDVDPETPPTQLGELLITEMGDQDGPFEVGRTPDRRVTWQCEPGPLAVQSSALQLAPTDTVLITGGARGITARVARELADRFQCKLVLVGSSPLPGEEDPDTVNFTKASELKAVLLKRLQAGGKTASPAAAESAYKRLIKDREIRTNLQAIRAVGSEVEYRAVDVRDAAAFSALLQEYSARGRLAGVIHGAGVIEDKLLRDKTPESFDRVFGTKVESTLTLVRNLNPEALKFFALFASITSRYGNRGQSDYAAANEVLSKTACELDRKWPGRVVSIAWGPWAEVGMVAELEKHLTARGLKLIEPALGAKFAVDELVYGSKGEPEVLIAGGTEQAAKPTRVTAPTAELVGVNGTN
jgi:NAD(P)-dependent dehydrogenase (short-subunit alcohol dehydrogenase family)/acyl carrier protein